MSQKDAEKLTNAGCDPEFARQNLTKLLNQSLPESLAIRKSFETKEKSKPVEYLGPVIYEELRKIAGSQMRAEKPNHTLQPTALVHEAYMRLCTQSERAWESRSEFFGLAAHMMRRVLVDHARAKGSQKRGSRACHVSLEDWCETAAEDFLPNEEILAVDSALAKLESFSPRQAKIVELRYFGGLSIEETAFNLGISAGTVKRDWLIAKAWLAQALSQES